MQKRFIFSLLLYCFSIQSYWEKPDWLKTDLRLGFGPAWTSEVGDTRFTFTSGAQGTDQNKFLINVGPWVDGGLQARIFDYIIFDVYGGGGWVRNGYGMIVEKALVPSLTADNAPTTLYYEYDFKVSCNFLTTFAGAGLCYNHCDRFFIALTAGYAFSQQKWLGVQFITPYTRVINNKWKSPYIGIEGAWDICDCLKFNVAYKALVGHIVSGDKLLLYGSTLSNLCRFVPRFFGNLINFGLTYQFANNWNTSLHFLYNTFQNFKKGCVTPRNTPTMSNLYLNRLRFNMFALTLSIGYNY